MLTPEQLEVQRSGGTFSDLVSRDGWTNDLPVLSWLLVVELIYLLSLPLALFIFRPLADRGIILARILGLLAVCYVAWVVVALGWVEFSRGAVYLGMAAVAVASAAVLWFRGAEIRQFVRSRWRLLIWGEALFLGAFLAFVAVRLLQPRPLAPVQGRREADGTGIPHCRVPFLQPATLRSLVRGRLPQLLLLGYFVIASINRVAAVIPTTAFNLAVPLFFALTFTGACSLGYNLAAGARDAGARQIKDRLRTSRGWRFTLTPVLCGLTAGLFVAVIGNLDGIVQVTQGTWRVAVEGGTWPGFDFWRSSRMIAPLESFEPPVLGFWLPEYIPGTRARRGTSPSSPSSPSCSPTCTPT